ncbi:uncharacterized protein LOC120336117 [Styela clava]
MKEKAEDGGKPKPKNWNPKSVGQLKKMAPQQRARYLAYEDPSKESAEAMAASLKRIHEQKSLQKRDVIHVAQEEIDDSENHSKLIGQLKAAEARNRIRVMRLRYQGMRAHEIKHLIACQPTSLKALRLEALVPPTIDNSNPGDALDKLQRARVETILEDENGLTTNRKLD